MLEVIELFCGAGGMSLGLQQAGMIPRVGIDVNPYCVHTYRRNFPASIGIESDVSDVRSRDLFALIERRENLVLAGCPPCQPFSQLHRRETCSEMPAFDEYLRLVWNLRPAWIVFENVPRIRTWREIWQRLLGRLSRMGYSVTTRVVEANEFGVPQRRQRLLLVASRREFEFDWPEDRPTPTVRSAIGHLPSSLGGMANHVTMTLSKDNLRRIRGTRPDGGISRERSASFRDSYGRMSWDDLAPTMTTKCISYSNGRFGHPELDRAITVREAACLQGFPEDFVFEGPLKETARQVGNAVPPPIARWIGEQILRFE